jgi:hypothetical protein
MYRLSPDYFLRSRSEQIEEISTLPVLYPAPLTPPPCCEVWSKTDFSGGRKEK